MKTEYVIEFQDRDGIWDECDEPRFRNKKEALKRFNILNREWHQAFRLIKRVQVKP